MAEAPTDYMRGAYAAHQILTPQMDAGVPSGVIEEIHREAEAGYDPEGGDGAERDFHDGYQAHAEDLLGTYRAVEQAEAGYDDAEPEIEAG